MCVSLRYLLALTLLIVPAALLAAEVNYDESKIPPYKLPDPLTLTDGTKVDDAEAWKTKRRGEVLSLFETHMFGKSPGGALPGMAFEELSRTDKALKGKAIRREVRVHFAGKGKGPAMDILIYTPAKAKEATPAFIGLNFKGNHSIDPDPTIRLSTSWMRKGQGIVNSRATEESRGVAASRWPVEKIIDAGYGLITIYYGDIDPDYHDGYKNGVHPLFFKDGQTEPAADEATSIGAWSWALSRAMDVLEKDPLVAHDKIALLGHSRLGKTSLWGGAQDERFAIVISNNSGCGGAALSRRRFGEKVGRINRSFPHWFCGNFKKYNENEDALPIDQHMLIALIAPRPVYIASAEQDRWADPRGEFLSGLGADPVYRLLGTPGLPTKKMPQVNEPVMGQIGYHIRSGKHDVTDFDWEQYIKFANKHWDR